MDNWYVYHTEINTHKRESIKKHKNKIILRHYEVYIRENVSLGVASHGFEET